ncbi:unnamed protein product [Caenorhabditis auriculariae]|uniref:Uncharacterized protein n=1 Tax=Caenorhabditis auriculariae TaxID=2777116 RepID=A0A8S1H007_9PELO|nr:unnamed protein product [Caenorhabditis auriculariae]
MMQRFPDASQTPAALPRLAMKAELLKPNGTKCLVCEHPDGGSAHFASTSCLACAAFFRRTVSLNITFHCKKDRCCTIFHELRMICRACRFAKCLAAGMKKECVQKRRSNKKAGAATKKRATSSGDEDPVPEVLATPSSSFFQSPPISDDANSPFSVEKKSPFTPMYAVTASPVKTEPCDYDGEGSERRPYTSEPSTSSRSPSGLADIVHPIPRPSTADRFSPGDLRFKIVNMTGPELLRHYVEELRKAMDRRRMMFTETPMLAVMEERGDMPFDTTSPPAHTMQRQYEAQKFDNLLAYEFCRSTPGFDLMDGTERAVFFRLCALSYALLDIAWITVQAYRENDESPLVMYTDGSVSTINDLSFGWEDEVGLQRGEKKTLFFEFIARFNEAVCKPFRSMNIDPVEYAALKAFCIWKLGYCEYSNKMKVMAKEHETALLIGLNSYYEDILTDPLEIAQRLGNMILMTGTVFEMNQLILETYKSAELFELFKLDTLSKLLLSL